MSNCLIVVLSYLVLIHGKAVILKHTTDESNIEDLNITTNTATSEPLWSYEDQSIWPGDRCQGAGRRQSPIDIMVNNVVQDYRQDFIKFGPLRFTGYQRALLTGFNNGHTIQFSSEGEEAIHPMMSGGPLEHSYRLEQVHFHWLSEHAIDGKKFPMEIHFVHVRSDLPVSKALAQSDGLAILSIFCNVDGEIDEAQEQKVQDVLQYLPKLTSSGNRISGLVLDLKKLFPNKQDSYFTYAGSLTSPHCNEVVTWILFDTAISISDSQYKLFGKVGTRDRHNFRALQKLRKHIVYRPPGPYVEQPKIVKVFKNVMEMFSNFFSNITGNFGKIWSIFDEGSFMKKIR